VQPLTCSALYCHAAAAAATAAAAAAAVPPLSMQQVEALLDRCHGGPPLVSWVVAQLEGLGYRSWAHRVVSSAGEGCSVTLSHVVPDLLLLVKRLR
jgi:predicted CxxxxCH...CXXCH cytochrome family protein